MTKKNIVKNEEKYKQDSTLLTSYDHTVRRSFFERHQDEFVS